MFLGTDFKGLGTGRGYEDVVYKDGSQYTYNGSPGGIAADPRLYGSASGNPMFDIGYRKPYLDKYDRLAVTVNTGRWTLEGGERRPIREHRLVRDLVDNGVMMAPPVTNATALRKEEWLELDKVVVKAARKRMRLYSDVNRLSGSVSVPGMSKMMLEYETMADPGEAIVDANGLTPGRSDETSFQLEGFPLMVTHADFWCDSRRLSISRNTGTPFDGTLGEACARRVGEMIEKTSIGTVTGVTYGGNYTQVGGYGRTSKVYGLTNFTNRITSTGYSPTGNGRAGTANGWTPLDTLKDVLAAIQSLRDKNQYGPWMIYHSTDWDNYLDLDYFTTTGVGSTSGLSTRTLRERLCAIGEGDGTTEGEKVILGCRRLDFLFASAPGASTGNAGMNYYDTLYPFTMILVQMTPDVIKAVNGLDATTVQWEEKGGMLLKFKVMAIQGSLIRADYYGNCGINVVTFS